MLTIFLAEATTCPAAAASVMGSPCRPTASAPGLRSTTMPAPTASAVMSAARRSTTDRGERSQPPLLFIDASTSIYAGAARLDQQEAAHSLSLGRRGETHAVHASHPARSAVRPDHSARRRAGRFLSC